MSDRRRPFRIGETVLVAEGITSYSNWIRDVFEGMVIGVPDPPGPGRKTVDYIIARTHPVDPTQTVAVHADKGALFFVKDRPLIDAIIAATGELRTIDVQRQTAMQRYISPIDVKRQAAHEKIRDARKALDDATQPAVRVSKGKKGAP